mgnify:FL=1
MNSSIIVFPGSNCDRDMQVALEKLQFKNTMVWHKDSVLPKSDLIVIPGGFSYGDYLRSGAIASKSNILKEVIKLANTGVPILGVCNGFQILIETGLLKGALLRNRSLKFISTDVFLKVENTENKFCSKLKKNQVIKLNIAHNEGNYFTDKEHLKEIENNDLVAFRYCDANGTVSEKTNINGSINSIAGIFNSNKNILGMMPHPERMINKDIHGDDGLSIFLSLIS